MKTGYRHCERSEAIHGHNAIAGLPRRLTTYEVVRFLAMTAGVLFSCLVTACGFEPVYGDLGSKTEYTAVETRLSQVDIANIPDRNGQYLRNALIDRLYPHARPGTAAYTLSVSKIEEKHTDLDITKSSDATRRQIRLLTKLTLTDRKAGAAVLDRDLSAIGSYNILGSEFTNRVSEENARQNALDDLAQQIELQLGLFFQRQ